MPVLCLVMTATGPAFADEPLPARPEASPPAGAVSEQAAMATAEQAFLEGRRLLLQGQPHPACSRFVASLALYSTAATLLNLGNCFEVGYLGGGLMAARQAFERALVEVQRVQDPLTQASLREEARHRLEQVNARIPKLRLAASSTEALEVLLNGVPFAQLGVAVPMNPGRYQLELRSGGCKPYLQQFELDVGRNLDLQLPPLQRCRFGRAPIVLGIAGAGVAAVWGIAAGLSYSANEEYSALVDRCSSEICDEPTRQRMHDKHGDARTAAIWADYVFAPASVLMLGTAFTLWWMDNVAAGGAEKTARSHDTRIDAGCSNVGCVVSAQGEF